MAEHKTFTIYQLVQDFATIQFPNHGCSLYCCNPPKKMQTSCRLLDMFENMDSESKQIVFQNWILLLLYCVLFLHLLRACQKGNHGSYRPNMGDILPLSAAYVSQSSQNWFILGLELQASYSNPTYLSYLGFLHTFSSLQFL